MERCKVPAVLMLGLLLVTPALAQDQSASPTDTVTLWHEAKALVPTRVLLPSSFDPAESHTLIIALHGYGSTAESFAHLASPFTQGGYIFAVPEAAYAVVDEEGELAYDWWLYQMPDNQEMHQRALMLLVEDHLPAVVDDLEQRYNIDQVYLMGFSQGALTAYLFGIYRHEFADGIIAFGSFTQAEWYPGNTLAEGRNVRVLILHGREDDRVPFSQAEQTRDLLTEHGYDVTFRPFDRGHTLPREELGFVIDWIREGAEGGR